MRKFRTIDERAIIDAAWCHLYDERERYAAAMKKRGRAAAFYDAARRRIERLNRQMLELADAAAKEAGERA